MTRPIQILSVIFLFLLCPFGTLLIAGNASDYYPVSLGNSWTSRSEPLDGSLWSNRWVYEYMNAVDEINGSVYVRKFAKEVEDGSTDEHYFQAFWLRSVPSGDIMLGAYCTDSCDISGAAIVDPPMVYYSNEMFEAGFSWTMDMDDSHWDYEVLDCTTTVVVPAGTFENCCVHREVKTQISTGDTLHIVRTYFAESVGQVKSVRDYPPEEAHITELHDYATRLPSVTLVGLIVLSILIALTASILFLRVRTATR